MAMSRINLFMVLALVGCKCITSVSKLQCSFRRRVGSSRLLSVDGVMLLFDRRGLTRHLRWPVNSFKGSYSGNLESGDVFAPLYDCGHLPRERLRHCRGVARRRRGRGNINVNVAAFRKRNHLAGNRRLIAGEAFAARCREGHAGSARSPFGQLPSRLGRCGSRA